MNKNLDKADSGLSRDADREARMIESFDLSKLDLSRINVLHEVLAERNRQEELKAECRFKYTCADIEMTNFERLAVLLEEFGEAARAALEMHNLSHDVHGNNLRKEMIQVAAVSVAIVEGLDADQKLIP